MAEMTDILLALPEKGWGTVRTRWEFIAILEGAGLIKAQYTHLDGVFQARLTKEGRAVRKSND